MQLIMISAIDDDTVKMQVMMYNNHIKRGI